VKPEDEPQRARVIIWRLKQELGKKSDALIESVRGLGYRLRMDRDEV